MPSETVKEKKLQNYTSSTRAALCLRSPFCPAPRHQESVHYISLNSEHNIVYLFVNRFLYPKDLTNFPGSINYHFSTICANGMQQYCRPSAVITGTWLWKEFHTEIRMQVSHLQEFSVVCSKGTCSPEKEALIRAGKCSSPAPDAPSPHHLITNNVPVVERWQKGPTPPLLSTNPPGFPAALCALPFNLSGPACVLLCSKNEAVVSACQFKLRSQKHGTVLLALWELSHHQDRQARAACWENEGTAGSGFSPASSRPAPSQPASNLHMAQQVQPGSPQPREPAKLSQPRGGS